MYNDRSLKDHGFPGESRTDGSVIAIKTHLMGGDATSDMKHYDQAVIIMRNPLDTIKSEWNRQKTQSHVKRVNDTAYERDGKSFKILCINDLALN